MTLPVGWGLLPGAPVLTRTGLAPARKSGLSGRSVCCVVPIGSATDPRTLPTDLTHQLLLLRVFWVNSQRRRWNRHKTVRKRRQKRHNVTLVLRRKAKIADQSAYIFRRFRRR